MSQHPLTLITMEKQFVSFGEVYRELLQTIKVPEIEKIKQLLELYSIPDSKPCGENFLTDMAKTPKLSYILNACLRRCRTAINNAKKEYQESQEIIEIIMLNDFIECCEGSRFELGGTIIKPKYSYQGKNEFEKFKLSSELSSKLAELIKSLIHDISPIKLVSAFSLPEFKGNAVLGYVAKELLELGLMGYEHCFNNNTMKYSFIYDIMVLSGLKVEPDNSYIKKENIDKDNYSGVMGEWKKQYVKNWINAKSSFSDRLKK